MKKRRQNNLTEQPKRAFQERSQEEWQQQEQKQAPQESRRISNQKTCVSLGPVAKMNYCLRLFKKRRHACQRRIVCQTGPKESQKEPRRVKTRAQRLKGSPWGPKIGNNDKREDEEPPKNEGLKKSKKLKLHNVALVRFTAAGVKINCHPEKKTRTVIKKRQ